MDMFWPADTLLVSNVAREAKRVAHPCHRMKKTNLTFLTNYIRSSSLLNILLSFFNFIPSSNSNTLHSVCHFDDFDVLFTFSHTFDYK